MKFVILSVRDEGDREITRTMQTTEKLDNLIDLYQDMVPIYMQGEGEFLYRGKPVDRMKTPADYKMSDWDELVFSSGIEQSTFVTLTVREEETGLGFTRTLRRTDRLDDLMDFYYDMVPTVEYGDGVFLFDGRRVRGDKTPKELGMVDGDDIEVTYRVRNI
ncbi:hypothetical protein PR202_gb21380 [Eleusine coracana subsp. coracana]|uniref:Ubiquitin-like domain-containing protein n=1 Tax=Eleusine coracana subsp. coracana TaxID=191504 RepID=A0AAV5FDT5_ELECO|nr:hypothetical protein QOZ80_7BG0605320 [Eleusine coracana subsp. coracana]GJN32843.1 hypothetical protein PR202_gb21380 [Eleusine coracana subsp. coracana]